MGQRAYRVIKIEIEETPLFKMCDNLYDWMDDNDMINEEGGFLSISVENLRKTFNEFKFDDDDWRNEKLLSILKTEVDAGNSYVDFQVW